MTGTIFTISILSRDMALLSELKTPNHAVSICGNMLDKAQTELHQHIRRISDKLQAAALDRI